MNHIVFFDDESFHRLKPITLTRPVAEIRTGILKNSERWSKIFQSSFSFRTEDYLSKKFPLNMNVSGEVLFINGSLLPDDNILNDLNNLRNNEKLVYGKVLLAYRTNTQEQSSSVLHFNEVNTNNTPLLIQNLWDIFSLNGRMIMYDYQLETTGRFSYELPSTNKYLKRENIFFEEGAKANFCIFNAEAGPIYLGKNTEVMEGSIIRGPFVLCEGAQIKLGAKIYGPTTIGPECRVGGEVNNSVMQGFSNKGHDGFLGNSVLGEWCNLGADTNNSNLKNNYGEVEIWNYYTRKQEGTGLQFCGLFMGDHSKCGINTMFNTGTVVGVSSNIFGAGFPNKFIPSFSWGGGNEFTEFKFDKAIELSKIVMERRKIEITEEDKNILHFIFENRNNEL